MNEDKAKLAVFISGGGTGLQSLIDASQSGKLDADIVLVVSSKRKAYGLQRAEQAGIDTFVFREKRYPDKDIAAKSLLAELKDRDVDYIALAGYLKLLHPSIIHAYHKKITNIHPALLPKFGGKGMYGKYVHEAVIAAGDKESGVSVHLVDEIYDNGRVLAQSKIPVNPDDTPETLAARVLKEEHKLYPLVLDKLIKGEYK